MWQHIGMFITNRYTGTSILECEKSRMITIINVCMFCKVLGYYTELGVPMYTCFSLVIIRNSLEGKTTDIVTWSAVGKYPMCIH